MVTVSELQCSSVERGEPTEGQTSLQKSTNLRPEKCFSWSEDGSLAVYGCVSENVCNNINLSQSFIGINKVVSCCNTSHCNDPSVRNVPPTTTTQAPPTTTFQATPTTTTQAPPQTPLRLLCSATLVSPFSLSVLFPPVQPGGSVEHLTIVFVEI
ncbi:hypothetical protein WMY93_033356 [Mugilogobius chulae]|uniref:UPAR/Ly6 domain-containing protein n=1 Tax=Mugilogobius chulae TaxID=88201 RepID=A0AAW0MKZ9_9GOBI